MKPYAPFARSSSPPGPQWTPSEVEIVREARKHWDIEDGAHTPRWLLDWIHFIAWFEFMYGEAETRERMFYDVSGTGRRQGGRV